MMPPATGGVVVIHAAFLPYLKDIWNRARRRIRTNGILSILLGLWLKTRFQKSGLLWVTGGWPLPEIENRGGRIEAGGCGFASGVHLQCWRGAVIRIGHGTRINRNVEIVAAQSVTIGRNCKIARDVIIMDTDQHQLPGVGLVVRPIEIEDNVWIGARAIILKGVKIGRDSIIGAGAVVTKSVPPGSVVTGPAARVIKLVDADGCTAVAPDLLLARMAELQFGELLVAPQLASGADSERQ